MGPAGRPRVDIEGTQAHGVIRGRTTPRAAVEAVNVSLSPSGARPRSRRRTHRLSRPARPLRREASDARRRSPAHPRALRDRSRRTVDDLSRPRPRGPIVPSERRRLAHRPARPRRRVREDLQSAPEASARLARRRARRLEHAQRRAREPHDERERNDRGTRAHRRPRRRRAASRDEWPRRRNSDDAFAEAAARPPRDQRLASEDGLRAGGPPVRRALFANRPHPYEVVQSELQAVTSRAPRRRSLTCGRTSWNAPSRGCAMTASASAS